METIIALCVAALCLFTPKESGLFIEIFSHQGTDGSAGSERLGVTGAFMLMKAGNLVKCNMRIVNKQFPGHHRSVNYQHWDC